MDSFEINKVIAAIVVTVLMVFGISKVSDIVFTVKKPTIEGCLLYTSDAADE